MFNAAQYSIVRVFASCKSNIKPNTNVTAHLNHVINTRDPHSIQSSNMINPLKIKIDNTNINSEDELNFLGISFNEQLNWKSHVDKISNRYSKTKGILNKLKQLLPLNIKIMLYNILILSHLKYGLTACGYRCDRIKTVRIVCLSIYNAHTHSLFKNLNYEK